MSGLLIEELHFAKGLDPVADAFDGTVYSDVINMRDISRIVFAVYCGVGTTGTSTLTVQACDDVTPSNRSAIPFHYREITTTAGSSRIVLVEVREDALSASGYGYVQLKAVESVNSPNLGGILVIGKSKTKTSSAKASAIV